MHDHDWFNESGGKEYKLKIETDDYEAFVTVWTVNVHVYDFDSGDAATDYTFTITITPLPNTPPTFAADCADALTVPGDSVAFTHSTAATDVEGHVLQYSATLDGVEFSSVHLDLNLWIIRRSVVQS